VPGYWNPNWFFASHIIDKNTINLCINAGFWTPPEWLFRLLKIITLTINLCKVAIRVSFLCCLARKNYIKQQSIWHAGYILAHLQRQQPGYNVGYNYFMFLAMLIVIYFP